MRLLNSNNKENDQLTINQQTNFTSEPL